MIDPSARRYERDAERLVEEAGAPILYNAPIHLWDLDIMLALCKRIKVLEEKVAALEGG